MTSERPLLCVVDDAQWIDGVSAQALAFVARRLQAESVVLLLATRAASSDELAGVPSILLGGLSDADARELLATVIPGRVDERVLERIIAEAQGNPLALLELPRGSTPAELAGGFALPDGSPLAGRIEESFRQRLLKLPPDTQRFLALAAADSVGDPALVWRAASLLGLPAEAASSRRVGRLAGPGPSRPVPAPARAIRGVSRRRRGCSARSASRSRRCDGRGRGSGTPRLAPGSGFGRPG